MGEAVDRLLRLRGHDPVALAAATVHEIVPASPVTAAEPSGQPGDSTWEAAAELVSSAATTFQHTPDLVAAYSDLQTAVNSRSLDRARSARYALVLAAQRRFVSQQVDQAVERVSLGLRDALMTSHDHQVVPLAGPPAFLADKGKKKPTGDNEAAEATNDDETTEDKPVGDMKPGDHFVHPDDKKKHELVSKKGGKAAGGKPAPWMVRSKPADGKGAPKSKMMAGDAKLPMVKKKAAA